MVGPAGGRAGAIPYDWSGRVARASLFVARDRRRTLVYAGRRGDERQFVLVSVSPLLGDEGGGARALKERGEPVRPLSACAPLPLLARLRRRHAQPRLLPEPGAWAPSSDTCTCPLQRHRSNPPAARPSPYLDIDVDYALEIYQRPASDPTEPEPVPDLEVDRTMP
jgi:hypothetical protein